MSLHLRRVRLLIYLLLGWVTASLKADNYFSTYTTLTNHQGQLSLLSLEIDYRLVWLMGRTPSHALVGIARDRTRQATLRILEMDFLCTL